MVRHSFLVYVRMMCVIALDPLGGKGAMIYIWTALLGDRVGIIVYSLVQSRMMSVSQVLVPYMIGGLTVCGVCILS